MNAVPVKPINLAKQNMFLMFEAPMFKLKKLKKEVAIWEGTIKPTPLSKEYIVRIEYKMRCRPKVTLPYEELDSRPPHTFKDFSMCLYHRNGLGSWNSSKHIGRHLVPNISLWLWCFEMWQATGVWYGEEYPHFGPKAG